MHYFFPSPIPRHWALLCGVLCCVPLRPVSGAESSSDGYKIEAIILPGASGVVVLDYFAYDRSTGQLWVPASNTGFVDIINEVTDSISQVGGFNTGEVELREKKVILGPTSVSVGDGVVYIGNRGDSTVCTINAHTLRRQECIAVASAPPGRRRRLMELRTWQQCANCGSQPALLRWA